MKTMFKFDVTFFFLIEFPLQVWEYTSVPEVILIGNPF